MASTKKKQDEKHLKMLREMVALPHNKQCFDCHQRGPTYINMTIGSYVCTACSGLLRGLNPPHRVKSISMASFTPDEMEFIKSHGNEFCRKVWLGLYDQRQGSQTESRDENKVKDFMTQKYERKRYYVAPTDTMKEEAKRMNESAISKTTGTRPLKSLLGENTPRLQVGAPQNKAPVVAATPAPISATPQSPGNASLHSSKSSGSTAMDLLGDLGGDPFASSASQSQAGGGFADFGNFGSTSTSQPPAFSQSTPLQPVGSGGQSTQPAFNGFPPATAPTQPQSNAAPSADKYSNLTDLFSGGTTETSSASNTGWSTSFSTASSVNWGGGGGGPSTSAGGINWGGDGSGGGNSQPSSGGLNWNSSSTSTQQPPAPSSMSGWGSSGAGGNTSASMSWGGVSASTQQANGLGAPGNPFLTNNATPNPFGGGAQTTLATQGGAGAGQPNPFGGQPAQGAGSFGAFGAPSTGPQPGGFGQFNTPASTAGVGGQFGQFGAPANTMGGGFGQFNTQNGGFGSGATSSAGFGAAVQTSSHQGFGGAQQQGYGGQQAFGGPPASQPGIPGQFGVQQPAGFGQQQHAGGFGAQPGQMQQQGFGGAPAQSGWGQPAGGPTPNPFMSTAQQYSAPKTGGANPFL